MTDLELIFKAEKEKFDIDKTTVKKLNEKYFKERAKLMSDLYSHLSFLEKYGIGVRYQSVFDLIYLTKNDTYVAQIKPKNQPSQRINGEFYYSLVPDTYIVDWSYRSWQKNEIEYTDIKELVKAIALKCRYL